MTTKPVADSAMRVLVLVVGPAVVLLAGLVTLNEVVFHGFGMICSDGSPEYDPDVCGVTWGAGVPAMLVGAGGAAAMMLAAWSRTFTAWALVVLGAVVVLVAVLLLWALTWAPTDPRFPEPAGPQLVLLAAGLAMVASGLVVRRAGRPSTARAARRRRVEEPLH